MNIERFFFLVKKNRTLLLLAAILLIIFHEYIVRVILMLGLAAIGMLTLRITRMIPHISIETITASAILVGYLWGWKLGLAFGVCAGLIGYVKISLIKLTTIVNSLFMGLCGVLAELLKNIGFDFTWAFIIAFFIRMNLGFVVFSQINPDVTENILHSYGDGLFNILIILQIMNLLHQILVGLP